MKTDFPRSPLAGRGHWVFDMDGTLTVAAHDFDAIRRELGVPAGKPLLETLATPVSYTHLTLPTKRIV